MVAVKCPVTTKVKVIIPNLVKFQIISNKEVIYVIISLGENIIYYIV